MQPGILLKLNQFCLEPINVSLPDLKVVVWSSSRRLFRLSLFIVTFQFDQTLRRKCININEITRLDQMANGCKMNINTFYVTSPVKKITSLWLYFASLLFNSIIRRNVSDNISLFYCNTLFDPTLIAATMV